MDAVVPDATQKEEKEDISWILFHSLPHLYLHSPTKR
jgi:hypothetical protein